MLSVVLAQCLGYTTKKIADLKYILGSVVFNFTLVSVRQV